MSRTAEPTLYDAGDPPVLRGRRCDACGYAFFPPQDYGCEICGAPADRLSPVDLATAGTVRNAVAVLRGPGAPCAIATIVLDDGPVLRGVLADSMTAPDPETRVHGVLVPAGTRDGHDLVELRFAGETR